MFDPAKPGVYEVVYRGLVDRLAEAPLESNAAALGLSVHDGEAQVELFGVPSLVGPEGVRSADSRRPPPVSHRIVLAHYLLLGGGGEPAGRFVPYRELPGGQDFARNLAVTVEGRLSQRFAGAPDALARAATVLAGEPTDPGVSCDGAYAFPALPRLPMMLTFYDQDEDFPAEAKVFYDANATSFLDLECLAVLGSILASELEATLA